ncbi:MAG: polysaccharide biosynthesis protein, partial [Acidobacteria bacterium]|nr:polysaccharide biosynthesis protein [Acidobacteriota bacterium]
MMQTLFRRHVLAGSCRAVLVGLSLWMAFLLRFDFSIPPLEFAILRRGLLIALLVKITVFYAMGLHNERWWRYLGFPDLLRILRANLISSGAFTLVTLLTLGATFSRSVYFLDFLMCFLVTAGTRFAMRVHEELLNKRHAKGAKGLLIYGAGVAGIALAREIRDNPSLGYQVLGFLDDDPRKQQAQLAGLPVLGMGSHASQIVAGFRDKQPRVEEIAVTMPSASGRQIRVALDWARATGLSCRVVPGLGELISGRISVGRSDISVTDLLDRDPVKLESEDVRPTVSGKPVLVTGAAGSIGSELCRQLAELNPSCLIALDQAESEMFRLQAELRNKFPELQVRPQLADIRELRRIDDIIYRFGVQSIFHAAAYKHVPIVEEHACEGARNNVLGTWNLVQAACRNDVRTFVMISTDKAVNPTSVMGLTKRVAELIVTAKRSSVDQLTRFVSVRFGNVLVSNGSVVPIFQNQIAAGGPVTVTHPDIRRYFMTVQEAVQLVLHASTIGKGSEIFVLEMGKPIRILNLARKMIIMAGFKPDEDIQIRFTGLRPGEKLFEEVKLDGEHILPTSHEKIKVFR